MSNRLPILDELALARNNRQRADWLAECPQWVIAHHSDKIRSILDAAGFSAGVRCLDAELLLLQSRRDKVGAYRESPNFNAHLARIDMAIAARREHA